MSATYVYVITDADGSALYVGHASDLSRRLLQHGRESWADRARKATATVYASKAEALAVERNLIADLEPEFNTQGNPGRQTFEQWLASVGEPA